MVASTFYSAVGGVYGGYGWYKWVRGHRDDAAVYWLMATLHVGYAGMLAH